MPPKILMVEDDSETQQSMQLLLTTSGYEVTTARNGAEALESARTSTPDLLLTDLNMPEMDGVELCRSFKAQRRLRLVPIIVASALPGLPAPLHGMVQAFFRKPLDLARLLSALAFYVPDK